MAPEFGAESSSRPNVLNLDLLIAREIINNERRESFNYYLKKLNFVVSRCYKVWMFLRTSLLLHFYRFLAIFLWHWESLKNEIIVFYNSRDLQQNYTKLQELLVYFINKDIYKCLDRIYKLACLFAAILKRIKTYCRNTMGQERLSSLALMPINKEILLQL